MALRRLPVSACVLEVERKFRSLAVRELTQHGGLPHFKSLQRLPQKIIRDSYYDKSNALSAAGAWIRNRDGEWQAKISKGGNYTNSRFEELNSVDDIAAYIKRTTGVDGGAAVNFGLHPIATFSTTRETWVADDEFHVVLDTMDFGHQVGEIELQKTLAGKNGGAPTEQEKQAEMQIMDERIVAFMKTYAWAFASGASKGKLTAYFERLRSLV
ncbi:CYTH-like domain-containing protein [Trichoderma austrokoningii]